ncbi:MAG TPA: hypothetical protein VFV72_10355 [Candidatus Limnocylindrales bacterium]|nr:hypothetical protein [Candidatus Limnocylindrales bacterium]
MAQTDARAGFRLPWSSERSNEQADTDQVANAAADVAGGWPDTDTAPTTDQPSDSAEQATDGGWGTGWGGAAEAIAEAGTADPGTGSESAAPAPAPKGSKKPSKFLADLTKAMQAAAEQERNETLTQFQADAKAHVEKIHERAATETTTLRRQADDDVAAVREWSKAEIARVREETETKITARKGRLDTEIEAHGHMIEREIEQVQAKVAGYEQEMAQFFERLLAEDDPTHFATMAENLPEPPGFDEMQALDPVEFAAQIEYEAAIAEPVATDDVATEETTEAEAAAATDSAWAQAEAVVTDELATDETTAEVVTGEAETATEGETTDAGAIADLGTTDGGWDTESAPTLGDAEATMEFPAGEVPEDFEVDREAAFAAIQAAAEAAASAEVATDAAARAEAVADIAIEIVGSHEEGSPDFEAAEAEVTTDGEIAEVGDDALAARLAGLVPGKNAKAGATETKSSQVVVVGLVSVASIASFKRHLGRLAGVQSVGVSSGPDGEFLFAVTHDADCSLRDAIPGLPSFQARVTGSSDGVLNVTAHDPEADS